MAGARQAGRRRGADDAGTAPEAETPHRCFTSWRVARIRCREGCRDRAAAAAAGDSEGRKANLFDHSTACATVELDIVALRCLATLCASLAPPSVQDATAGSVDADPGGGDVKRPACCGTQLHVVSRGLVYSSDSCDEVVAKAREHVMVATIHAYALERRVHQLCR